MKALTTVAMYGLVPVPATHDTQSFATAIINRPWAPTRTQHCSPGIGIWRRKMRSRAPCCDLEDLPAQQTATKSSRADALRRAPAARS